MFLKIRQRWTEFQVRVLKIIRKITQLVEAAHSRRTRSNGSSTSLFFLSSLRVAQILAQGFFKSRTSDI